MDIIGFLGKKVDLVCTDGEKYSGYVFDVLDEEESGIGVESIDLSPLDVDYLIAIPVDDIKEITVDERYRELNFR